MFQRFIDAQLARVKLSPQAHLLADKVYERFENALRSKVGFIADSTVTHAIAQVVAADNPFAARFPALLTEEERQRAQALLTQQLDSGEMSLPEPLVSSLELQLENTTDAFLEALERLAEHRVAIGDALLGGKRFSRIDDVFLSKGDTHNHGRQVAIFHTDAVKLVYKPHDMRVDGCFYDFVERFFSDYVGVPKSIAFGEAFGVSEFIEKKRASGDEEARRFWYALGGLTAFAKLMGSTDMHFENILCHGAKPYILDLETILSPVSREQSDYVDSTKAREYTIRSLSASLLMPHEVNHVEVSVLTNTSEEGISPVVDGEFVSVQSYLPSYTGGFHAAYSRALENKEQIRSAILSFPSDMKIRCVMRPTRTYWLLLQKLNHHSSLATWENRERDLRLLDGFLHENRTSAEARMVESEMEQLCRGDVPYFYARAKGLSLCADGKELIRDKFSVSAIDHVLDILAKMDEADESFDLAFIDHAIDLQPQKAQAQKGTSPLYPNDAAAPLAPGTASEEAGKLFNTMYELGVRAPNGELMWPSVNISSHAVVFDGPGLFDGVTGLAVFACACAHLLRDGQIQERADVFVQRTIDELRGMCLGLENNALGRDSDFAVGEDGGLGGCLTALALMRRYTPRGELDELSDRILHLLENVGFSACHQADRINGLAALVSALCRFEEYRGNTRAIRAAADRILELKTLEYKHYVLWKTLAGIPRPLSGAGHGMSGIAEALLGAARITGDERYAAAAAEALQYELDAHSRYAHKFGTWADLRDFPPRNYMHGYCAGAPGTGIMLSRLTGNTAVDKTVQTLAELTKTSVGKLPLNTNDHLCCGNAAVAEYYLSTGDIDGAGKVLGAMHERSLKTGGYKRQASNAAGTPTASLFNGIGGIGYEMLRYAYPDHVLSIM